jgi:hypothetical protein
MAAGVCGCCTRLIAQCIAADIPQARLPQAPGTREPTMTAVTTWVEALFPDNDGVGYKDVAKEPRVWQLAAFEEEEWTS